MNSISNVILCRIDFQQLQEIFDACDTLRHTHNSTNCTANDIIDTILTHTELDSRKMQNKEISSKLFRIEVLVFICVIFIIMHQISNICIRRSLKIVAQNSPLVSRDEAAPAHHAQKAINSVLYLEFVTLSGRVLNTFTTKVCYLCVTRVYHKQVLCDDANPVWLEVFVSDIIK